MKNNSPNDLILDDENSPNMIIENDVLPETDSMIIEDDLSFPFQELPRELKINIASFLTCKHLTIFSLVSKENADIGQEILKKRKFYNTWFDASMIRYELCLQKIVICFIKKKV